MKAEHEVDLKKKDEGARRRQQRQAQQRVAAAAETVEHKFIHLDQEHEQEINYNNEEFETIITKMEKERSVNQGEIATLTDEKKKLTEPSLSAIFAFQRRNRFQVLALCTTSTTSFQLL